MTATCKFALITDTQIFFTQRTGGASVYWYELLRRMLDDSLIEVHLLVADASYNNIQMSELDLSKAIVHKERARSNNGMRLMAPVVPDSIKLPKVFHSSYMRLPVSRDAVKVITVHDLTHQKCFPASKSLPNSFLKRRAITGADGIISISENTQRDLFELFPSARKKTNTIIYNGASDDYRVDPVAVASPDVVEASREPFVLYVGARNDYKNFKMAEEALLGIDGIRLVAVGGEPDFSTSLNDRATHLKGLSNADLNYLYNKAVCLFYPSLYEGFGIPVVEASKAGCPVIACNRSSIPKVAGEMTTLLEPGDIDGAVRTIKGLLAEPPSSDKRVRASSAADRFSWDACYEQVVDFYERLIVD